MRNIKFSFLFLLFLSIPSIVFSKETNTTTAISQELNTTFNKENEINKTLFEVKGIEREIPDDNVWVKSYASYLSSLEVKENLNNIKKRIAWLKRHAKTIKAQDELAELTSKENILNEQIDKFKSDLSTPFSKLITPHDIGEIPEISNPFKIFTGLSLIKTIDASYDDYVKRKKNLSGFIGVLKKELILYKKLSMLDVKKYQPLYKKKKIELDRLERALDTMNVTLNVYQKRLEVAKISLNKGIKKQVYRLVNIGIAIFVVFVIFFLLKLIVKRYITDNERFYMANKILTFTNFTVIVFILFFNYIENVGYLVTILGFASAGIAIAMKDWFMSLLGWLVIVFGGSIHVGDRIRVDMGGMRYVGDVLDISLLRITILEDITLTSIMQNRRAGRIIFIPNNYIFTHMIANYTHNSLKTVWDGVKITITFDSNHKKAMHIVKEVAKKFSKGYTDITRKQLNKLRQHYSLKNTNVEPRIYSFIEPNGIDIEAWYLTNAYATLTLRSVISTEILDAFKKEDDITIAYPTQKLHVDMQSESPAMHNDELV